MKTSRAVGPVLAVLLASTAGVASAQQIVAREPSIVDASATSGASAGPLMAASGGGSSTTSFSSDVGTPAIGGRTSPTLVSEVGGETASPLSVTVGASWLRGDFGAATDTQVWSVPIGVRYTTGNLRLTANIPYMRIESDGLLFTGIDGTPLVVAPRTPSFNRVRKGLGDVTLGAAYTLPSESTAGFDVELQGRVKLPTASRSSGLSTRKTDWLVGAEVSRTYGAVTPFVSASYRFFGDMDGWDLRNGMAASVGATVAVGSNTLIGSYDYARRASRFVGDSHELFAGFSGPILQNKVRWTIYGTAGLSRGAPDAGAGLSLAIGI